MGPEPGDDKPRVVREEEIDQSILGGVRAIRQFAAPPSRERLVGMLLKCPCGAVAVFTSGLTGFFDMRDGKLYLYDGNLENPFVVRQLQTLGASR